MEKTYYSPLGAANRYENAKAINLDFAEKINQEALHLAHTAKPVLEIIRKNPERKNFHHPLTGSQWMGHWLISQKEYILRELYGVFQFNGITNVPHEVSAFVRDVEMLLEN